MRSGSGPSSWERGNIYEHTLTVSEYYTDYWEFCLSVTSWNTTDPVHRAGDRACHYNYPNAGSVINILTGLIYPCKPIITWRGVTTTPTTTT